MKPGISQVGQVSHREESTRHNDRSGKMGIEGFFVFFDGNEGG